MKTDFKREREEIAFILVKDTADKAMAVRRALSFENLCLYWYFLKGGSGLENQETACQL